MLWFVRQAMDVSNSAADSVYKGKERQSEKAAHISEGPHAFSVSVRPCIGCTVRATCSPLEKSKLPRRGCLFARKNGVWALPASEFMLAPGGGRHGEITDSRKI